MTFIKYFVAGYFEAKIIHCILGCLEFKIKGRIYLSAHTSSSIVFTFQIHSYNRTHKREAENVQLAYEKVETELVLIIIKMMLLWLQ